MTERRVLALSRLRFGGHQLRVDVYRHGRLAARHFTSSLAEALRLWRH